MDNTVKFEICKGSMDMLQSLIQFMNDELHIYNKQHQAAFVELTLSLTDAMKLLDYDAWCVYYDDALKKLEAEQQEKTATLETIGKNLGLTGQYL